MPIINYNSIKIYNNLCSSIFGARRGSIIINQQRYIQYHHITTNMSNNINASTEEVFEYTGEGCSVPKDVTIVRFHPSVVEVENRAFLRCDKLRKVIFNGGLQKIGYAAFRGCTSLESIRLPSTVIEIGQYTFDYCNSLREVVLNEVLQKIGEATAFSCCTSLSTIVLPSTVTDIGQGAFSCCSSLREVALHGVPRAMGKDAFRYCTSLERFTFPTISTRLDNLVQTGHWEEIGNEVDTVRGVVERSGGDYFASAQTMDRGDNWNRVRAWNAVIRDLNNIVQVISYYEIKEGTSMLELALWKFKLDQVDKANPIPRKKCRMDVPGPVKDIILTYLR